MWNTWAGFQGQKFEKICIMEGWLLREKTTHGKVVEAWITHNVGQDTIKIIGEGNFIYFIIEICKK